MHDHRFRSSDWDGCENKRVACCAYRDCRGVRAQYFLSFPTPPTLVQRPHAHAGRSHCSFHLVRLWLATPGAWHTSSVSQGPVLLYSYIVYAGLCRYMQYICKTCALNRLTVASEDIARQCTAPLPPPMRGVASQGDVHVHDCHHDCAT